MMVTVLALAIRIVYTVFAPRVDPILSRDPLYGDAQGYHLLALNLLNEQGLSWDGQQPTSYRAPGYPAFLALVYYAIGSNLAAVRLIQAFLGALTCIPVFWIAWRLAGPPVAMLAGLGIALHPLLIYMASWLYSETLFILLFWLALWMLLRLIRLWHLQYALLSGGLLGFATLIRPEVVAFPLFCLILGLGFRWHRRRLCRLLLIQAMVLLIVLPWSVRNIVVHQAFVLVTTNTGSNLYGGNNPYADGGFVSNMPYVLPGMSEVESDHQLTRIAMEWIIHHPFDFVKLLPAKLVKFFSPLQMGTSARFSGRVLLWADVSYGLYLLSALLGSILLSIYGGGKEGTLMLIASIAYFALVALAFFGGTRFALPTAPALLIFAAFGLVWGATRRVPCARRFRARR